jgi:hypothetical protein
MRAATLERLIWVLIFGGMLLFTLGLFVGRGGGDALAWVMLAVGAAAVVVGVVLVFVRARMPGDDARKPDQ